VTVRRFSKPFFVVVTLTTQRAFDFGAFSFVFFDTNEHPPEVVYFGEDPDALVTIDDKDDVEPRRIVTTGLAENDFGEVIFFLP
jgi:hypothetical protein